MSEYFYVVDEEDNVLGKATREECHSSNKFIHRSVYIFVLNDKNKVFLQRRSMSKDLYPGYYTGSATGHVDYGEDYDEAARRELKEELGIDAPLKRLEKFKSFSDTEREISVLYLCRYNDPVRFTKKEIADGVFMSIEEIKRSLETGEKKFAYGFNVAFKELLEHMRNTNYDITGSSHPIPNVIMKRKVVDMKYPPCGRLCEVCGAKREGICQGCVETNGKPFHLKGKTCPLWECGQKYGIEHCAQCEEFLCGRFLSWFNPAHGKKSVLPYVGLLLIREKLGIEEWRKWAKINKEK